MKKILVFVLCIVMCLPFFGCEADSYKAFMSIESGTKTSWNQKHDYLEGTKSHFFNLGKEPQEMIIEVVTEEGEIDIKIADASGNEILSIENAVTGNYSFSAEGRIKISIYCKEHRGSVLVQKVNS